MSPGGSLSLAWTKTGKWLGISSLQRSKQKRRIRIFFFFVMDLPLDEAPRRMRRHHACTAGRAPRTKGSMTPAIHPPVPPHPTGSPPCYARAPPSPGALERRAAGATARHRKKAGRVRSHQRENVMNLGDKRMRKDCSRVSALRENYRCVLWHQGTTISISIYTYIYRFELSSLRARACFMEP